MKSKGPNNQKKFLGIAVPEALSSRPCVLAPLRLCVRSQRQLRTSADHQKANRRKELA
jgi:hypothetical protein